MQSFCLAARAQAALGWAVVLSLCCPGPAAPALVPPAGLGTLMPCSHGTAPSITALPLLRFLALLYFIDFFFPPLSKSGGNAAKTFAVNILF